MMSCGISMNFTMQAMHLRKHLPSIVPKHGIGFYLREDLAHNLSRKTVWGRSNDIAKMVANYANTALRHSLFLHRCLKKFAAYFLPVLHRAYVSHVGSRVRSLRSKNRDFIIIGIEVFFSGLIMTRCTFLWLVNSSRRRIH